MWRFEQPLATKWSLLRSLSVPARTVQKHSLVDVRASSKRLVYLTLLIFEAHILEFWLVHEARKRLVYEPKHVYEEGQGNVKRVVYEARTSTRSAEVLGRLEGMAPVVHGHALRASSPGQRYRYTPNAPCRTLLYRSLN